jgi:hypothetical protein
MAGTHRPLTVKLSLLLAATALVCLGQFPPSDSVNYAAKVVALTGQVSVLRDSRPWALDVGGLVQVQELIMTGPDGHAQFQISDGSSFEVFPNSQVQFRKSAPSWRDLIDVYLGRVRVHIEHLGGQPNPNRVLTPAAVISVRGTTFDVTVEDDDATTVIEVEEGLVEVEHRLLPRGNPKVLSPDSPPLRVYRSQPLEAGLIDKGTVWKHAARMVMDAVVTYATRVPKISVPGGSAGGGTIGVGDTKGGIPPPPIAPPPPPPPPSAPPPALP